METLGFYPLTIILTYLGETDGTCLLLTKRYYAKQILPMFRRKDVDADLVAVIDPSRERRRYQFQVSPVQGPAMLLQRLNTRRLGKRQRCKQYSASNEKALFTAQLADAEWIQAHRNFMDDKQHKSGYPPIFQYPPPLELLRFLDQTSKSSDGSFMDFLKESLGVSLLISYPRSGNTLLRTLLERTTGIVTGSDTRPDRTLSKALAEAHNLVGEGLVQRNKTCFVKTHWPERVGCQVFEGHRAILIVRNPFDAIDSYWNLNVTNTHTETVTDDVYDLFRGKFEQLAKNEINIWCDYHHYWLEKNRKLGFPLLIIRFEDLIQSPAVEIARILQFISPRQNGSSKKQPELDPFWQQRIIHATTTTEEHNTLGSYRPRTATKGVTSIGKSLRKGRYSPEMLDYFHSVAAEIAEFNASENLLTLFGYHIFDQQFPENFVRGTAEDIVLLGGNDTLQRDGSSKTLRINSGSLVRPKNCPFGRDMRNWRLQHTSNDTEPFPRVPR